MRSFYRWVLGACLVGSIAIPSALRADPSGSVDVIRISGLLDQTLAQFVTETVERVARSGSQLVILQIDSRGALSEDLYDLLALVSDPPLPLAVWVGPAPAHAFGGAGQLLARAPIQAAAPLVELGYLSPTVAGRDDRQTAWGPPELRDTSIMVTGVIPGLVSDVEPALAQLIASLDGRELTVRGAQVVLSTLMRTTDDDGNTVLHPVETRFWEPGLAVRLLRVGISPDAMFLFLAVGLALVAFEFYALGPGIAAGVALLALLISSYGLVTLPLNWWAVLAVLGGLTLLTVQFQRNGAAGAVSALGVAFLFVGGLYLTAGAPQFGPRWWVTALTTAAVAFMFVLALPAVTRARLTTRTIGRDHLIGRSGVAATDFVNGEGTARVDGARWKASAHREAGLRHGDPVIVTGVQGVRLAVERLDT